MKYIDLNTWKRKAHFEFFLKTDLPHYHVCFNLEITNFLAKVKREKLSFYYAMIYFATNTANQIPEFKQRLRGEQVIEHTLLTPSFTDLSKGEDLFKIVSVPMRDNLADFVKGATEKSTQQAEYFSFEKQNKRDDLLYLTSLPWISFTSISHPVNLGKDDTIPRIGWGRYFRENNKILLPFSIQVNHLFIDGIHLGRYQAALIKNINEFQES